MFASRLENIKKVCVCKVVYGGFLFVHFFQCQFFFLKFFNFQHLFKFSQSLILLDVYILSCSSWIKSFESFPVD